MATWTAKMHTFQLERHANTKKEHFFLNCKKKKNTAPKLCDMLNLLATKIKWFM